MMKERARLDSLNVFGRQRWSRMMSQSLRCRAIKATVFSLVLCIDVLSGMTGTTLNAAVADLVPLPEAARSNIPAPEINAASWVLLDQHSGWVVSEHNSNERVEPASLSKLMTAYVVFDKLLQGAIRGDTLVSISEQAWRTEGSRMFVEVNSQVTVSDLLHGLIVQSGNDSAVALAEHIAGSEEGFAQLMNQTAASLGLAGTQFQNSTGLPHPDHYSTARDITVLASRLISDFPDFYKLYSVKEFSYNDITQKNRNVLLWRDETVDGMKTGHTKAAGYCLVGSAQREDTRFVATVMGAKSAKYRAQAVYALLQHGFAAYESAQLYGPNQPVSSQKVYFGDQSEVQLGARGPLVVTIPKNMRSRLRGTVTLNDTVKAPLAAGQQVGTLSVALGDKPLGNYPLVAMENVALGAWWSRIIDKALLWWE